MSIDEKAIDKVCEGKDITFRTGVERIVEQYEAAKASEQPVECHSGCTEHVCRAEDGTFVEIVAKSIEREATIWSGPNRLADIAVKALEPHLRYPAREVVLADCKKPAWEIIDDELKQFALGASFTRHSITNSIMDALTKRFNITLKSNVIEDEDTTSADYRGCHKETNA